MGSLGTGSGPWVGSIPCNISWKTGATATSKDNGR